LLAGNTIQLLLNYYQENIFVKKLLQSYAYDLHILTPLPESQFTAVFIFLAAVQVLPLSPTTR
jgi:hypothetical protein